MISVNQSSAKANMTTTAEKMLAAIRSKLTHVTYLQELEEKDCDDDCDCTHCQRIKVCDECGCQGGCEADCANLASD